MGLTVCLLIGTQKLAAQPENPAPVDSNPRPKLESSRLLSPLTLGPFSSELGASGLGASERGASELRAAQRAAASAPQGTLPSFQQTLQLQAYGGTSSKLELQTSDMPPLRSARLIAVVDGVLRVVPLVGQRPTQATTPEELLESLVARFLTPTRSLQYQLQFLFSDGRSQLTKWFSLSESCFQRVPVQELVGIPEEKQRLIAELVALDRDAARLTHALSSIQKLVETQ